MVFKFNIVYDVVYCEVQEELVSFPCELLFNNIRHGECVNKKLSKSDLSSTNFMASWTAKAYSFACRFKKLKFTALNAYNFLAFLKGFSYSTHSKLFIIAA